MNRLGSRLLLAMLAVALLSLAVAPLAQVIAGRITFSQLPDGFRTRVLERTDPQPWFRPPGPPPAGGGEARGPGGPDAAPPGDDPFGAAGLREENDRLFALFGAFRAAQQRTLVAGIGFAVLVCVLLAWWLSRSVARPIEAVSAGASRLADGHLETRVTLPHRRYQPRETRDLADGFNGMAEALERYEEERRAMIADIAHELRTPLASLAMRLEALEDGLVAFGPAEAARLRQHTAMLERLIDDLRLLSLADAGRLALDLQETDLVGWLQRTRGALQDTVERRGAALRVSLPGGPVPVRIDGQRLRQVLHNLLDNAGKATPEGERVDLELTVAGGEAILRVRDRGPGIPEEELETVFERFVRGRRRDTRDTRDGGGSGLGLAIARTLTTLHGGRIGVRSRAGGGRRVRGGAAARRGRRSRASARAVAPGVVVPGAVANARGSGGPAAAPRSATRPAA